MSEERFFIFCQDHELEGYMILKMKTEEVQRITEYIVKRIKEDPSLLTESLAANLRKLTPIYKLKGLGKW